MKTKSQKCKVVMLPTEKESNLVLSMRTLRKDNVKGKSELYQHLYILSDEEIKGGDWCIDIDNKIFIHENHFPISIGQRKIIATTDKSLNLPSPSPDFIQKFIEEYNKGNIITEVMVEYEEDYNIDCGISSKDCSKHMANPVDCKGCKFVSYKLKVDKNNCITIRKCKESWNREEVKNLIQKALAEFQNKPHSYIEYSNWIENNL